MLSLTVARPYLRIGYTSQRKLGVRPTLPSH
jgi:hypothetical protein